MSISVLLLGADVRDVGHLVERLPDVSEDNDGESDEEGDDGDHEDRDDEVLDVLGNGGVIHLLSSDTVHRPDDHKVLRQNVSANSFCE